MKKPNLISKFVMIASIVGMTAELSAATQTGRVAKVTLHREQALVTREIDIRGEPGTQEVIIGELPEMIVPGSLFAESDREMEVRAVQFRTRAVGQSPRENVHKLQLELASVEEKSQLNQHYLDLAAKQSAYLDKLEQFVAPTATAELSSGVLNAGDLEQITKFSFERRKTIAEEQFRLQQEQKSLQEKASLLKRKLAELTSGSEKTVREAVLFLHKHDATERSVRLNYLVNQCGWSPSYVIRGNSKSPSTSVEYNALIHQMSGENWADVELTLSTASPTLSAAGPGLAPLEVTLDRSKSSVQQDGYGGGDGAYQAEAGYGGYGGYGGPQGNQGGPQQAALQGLQQDPQMQIKNLVTLQNEALLGNLKSTNFADNTRTNWSVNQFANDLACAALVGDDSVVTTLKNQMDSQAEEPSLSYTLNSPIRLDSRRANQVVRIVQSEMPSTAYFVATPILTSFVFREAELTNHSEEDLLAGPITVYLDNRFVGRGEIPTVGRGQTFVVGFGADPQLRVRRELADRTDGVNGGNRELRFAYRVALENFKSEPASIRVVERLPIGSDATDIRVTLTKDAKEKLSMDKVYRRTELPRGILRWDVEAPAQAIGEDAHVINYAYSVEHDRKYQIALTSSPGKLEQFQQLQRVRAKR